MNRQYIPLSLTNTMLRKGVEGMYFFTFSAKNAIHHSSLVSWSNGNYTISTTCSFTGKERDKETGYSYFGARYYDADLLTSWMSVDPMSDKYPSLSPYNYCAWNPIKLIDMDGREVSTHIDQNGNVVAVYDDGNFGIYRHSNQDIVQSNKSGSSLCNNPALLIGSTLCIQSFHKGDKIDVGSYCAKEWMINFEMYARNSPMGNLGLLQYASMAVNGMPFDPKSKMKNGSQLSEGVYISPRDLGNFAAGYMAKHCGMTKETMMAVFGAFNYMGNNVFKLILNYSSTIDKIMSEPIGFNKNPIYPSQLTYGEDGISNYFQRLGYHDIRTLDQYKLHYGEIF